VLVEGCCLAALIFSTQKAATQTFSVIFHEKKHNISEKAVSLHHQIENKPKKRKEKRQ